MINIIFSQTVASQFQSFEQTTMILNIIILK
jgi:hypothetical protein